MAFVQSYLRSRIFFIQGKREALETVCLRPDLSVLEDFAQQMKGMYCQKYAEDVPLAKV